MDLIEELIQNKKNQSDLKIKELLTELIQYERLSRKDTFKHLANTPLLQKKMPYCWKAFQGDTRMYWLLSELSTIMQLVSSRPLDIFGDLSSYYTKKEQTQITIIGNANNHRFTYLPLRQLPYPFDYGQALYLTNEKEDKEMALAIIHTQDNKTTVYSGTVDLSETDEHNSSKENIEPFAYEKDGVKITIPTYSVQGNNDYPFAFTDHYSISMPNNASIRYTEKHPPYTQTTVDLAKNDIQTLAFHKNDLTRVAQCLLDYAPEIDNKAALINSIRTKGREKNENQ